MTPLDPRALRPASLAALYWAFTSLALQGFGGVLAVAQRELVERRGWVNREQFLELLAMSQVLPGPNIVNLGLMLGDRWFGLRGAFAAIAGLLSVPLVIVLGLASLYGEFSHLPLVAGALRGMAAVAAGLVVATAWKLSSALHGNVLGRPVCLGIAVLTFVAIAWMRWPLISVLLVLGVAAVAFAWTRLAPART
jgi:chromate transporter